MKTITFYSYKGGVGRSLALANIATRLLEFNRNVCLLDFDLEAPGLPLKFDHLSNKINPEKGIVDYIYSFTNEGKLKEKIADYAIQIAVNSKSKLHLIPAGNINSSTYWKRLSAINWHNFLFESPNGLGFFLDLKEKIKSEINPDFLLIDSRTGISEMSGISLSLLADEVVIVAANNKENFEGVKRIIEILSDSKETILGKPIKITFVLSRIPFTDKPEDKAKEQHLISRVKNELAEFSIDDINVIHSDRDLEVNEQIKIGYEKDDSAVQISRDYLKLFEKLTENVLTEQETKKFLDIKESEKLFKKATHAFSYMHRLELISAAISLNPTNIDFIIYRGNVYGELRDFDNANKDFELALSLDTYALEPREKLANIAVEAGNFYKAEQYLKDMLAIDETDYSAMNGLGVVYSAKGDFIQSVEYFKKAIELYPEFSLAYNNIADAYMRMERYNEALITIYKALELDSDEAMSYVTLAEINAHLGNQNEFYLNLELALKNDPRVIEKALGQSEIYQKFLVEERMKRLLEKYDVGLTT